MEDLFSYFSADQLLMIWCTVTFWYSLHTSGNANDEPLAKIALLLLLLLLFFFCTPGSKDPGG